MGISGVKVVSECFEDVLVMLLPLPRQEPVGERKAVEVFSDPLDWKLRE